MKLVVALSIGLVAALACHRAAAEGFSATQCVTRTPPPPSTGVPATWSDFEIEGKLIEPAATVRALFAPTVQRYRALTDAARKDIDDLATTYGYHLALSLRDGKLIVALSPLPIARKIIVDIKQDLLDTLLEDEIKRRMRVRPGTYLPWDPLDRKCAFADEEERIVKFLQDEGYFDATVALSTEEDNGVHVRVKVKLGQAYTVGASCVKVENAKALEVPAEEIIAAFQRRNCVLFDTVCFGKRRFTANRHKEDLQEVRKLFQKHNFPSVHVSDNLDITSFNRRTKEVCFDVSIDQRRKLDVQFKGHDGDQITTQQLHDALTFDTAGSSDDVEANESARAITTYLQSRSYFDARVTWSRERFDAFDSITYRIEQGNNRQVRDIDWAGKRDAISDDELEANVIGTRAVKLSAQLFGGNGNATSSQLSADVDLIVDAYRKKGYRDAQVRVSAATSPDGLDDPALTAGLLGLDRGREDVYVRYTIDQGDPTLVVQIQIDVAGDTDVLESDAQRRLCHDVLGKLAELLDDDSLENTAVPNRCVATAPKLMFREDDFAEAKDKLREWLWSKGRPRTRVEYTPAVVGQHRIAAHFKLTNTMELKMGHVVIRGNFRTRDSIILGELKFREGQPLTSDALAEAARRLRNTGLFEAVILDPVDLETTSTGEVNAVVRVEERYDYLASVDLALGYSSYSGLFFTVAPSAKNLGGLGLSLDLAGTIGFDPVLYAESGTFKLKQLSLESTLRFPQWLVARVAPIPVQTDITAFHRLQDTPRFGPLTTDGFTLAFARSASRPRTDAYPARALTLGVHYDFRIRERQLDVLRPVGSDFDESQVPITTRTGSVGITGEWEQRTDRRGVLSPLAPEAGFRLQGQASFASTIFGGQDDFLKLSAAASKYYLVGNNLVLHGDFRYDQGIPLGGAVLLPDVERFFAGGDSTVRGYDDDRLATEIVQVGVPPFGNVSQIRILPSGGNIRVMGSLDAQLRIYKVLATAVFTDAGLITNRWAAVSPESIRPSIGMALVRVITPFGAFAFERAVPLRPQLGDDPRGRWHISFAARAQF